MAPYPNQLDDLSSTFALLSQNGDTLRHAKDPRGSGGHVFSWPPGSLTSWVSDLLGGTAIRLLLLSRVRQRRPQILLQIGHILDAHA
jgi:hypothetical protein